MIENTSDRDPLIHLAGMIGARDGGASYITDMEAAGQRQLVKSSQLPKDGPWDELTALGFVRGADRDDLFCEVTLPPGWAREGSDHAMWSYITDDRGIRRVSVFYKAAFYDRSAHCGLVSVGGTAATDALYDDEPAALPERWAQFTEDERAAFAAGLDRMAEQTTEYPTIYGKHADRLAAVRALLAADAGQSS